MAEEKARDELIQGIDFTIDPQGRYVFTRAYLLKRGECCGSKCRNCPYDWKNVPPQNRIEGEPQPPLDEQQDAPAQGE